MLSQVDLAVGMGDRYDQTMISHVESGRSGFVADGIARAALVLNTSADYLLGLTDDPTPARDQEDKSPTVDIVAVNQGGRARWHWRRIHRRRRPGWL